MLMKMFQRATVKKNERALLLRNGSFDRVLRSGTYWLFAGTDQIAGKGKGHCANQGKTIHVHHLPETLLHPVCLKILWQSLLSG